MEHKLLKPLEKRCGCMSKYEIWITSKDGQKRLFKSYSHKSQAVIWCFLNNFVSSGRGCYFLDERIEIREV